MDITELLTSFEGRFQKRSADGDIVAFRALTIIKALRDSLTAQELDYSTLYKRLGYQQPVLSTGKFIPLTIKAEELGSHLLLNDFISLLKSYQKKANKGETEKLLTFIAQYQQDSLTPALQSYKATLLTIKDQQQFKRSLHALLNSLIALTQDAINQHQQQQLAQKLNQKDREFSVSEVLGKKFTEQAKSALSHHLSSLSYAPPFTFLDDLQLVLNKERLAYSDITQLKASSRSFEQAVLQLKPIQEIQHFNWLLNMLCNLLNLFGNFIESEKATQIKQQFLTFKQWLSLSENNVAKVDNYIQRQNPRFN